jgi:hypothetical protein
MKRLTRREQAAPSKVIVMHLRLRLRLPRTSVLYVTHLFMSVDDGASNDLTFTLDNVMGTDNAAITLTFDLPAGAVFAPPLAQPIVAFASNKAMTLTSATPQAGQIAYVAILGYSK